MERVLRLQREQGTDHGVNDQPCSQCRPPRAAALWLACCGLSTLTSARPSRTWRWPCKKSTLLPSAAARPTFWPLRSKSDTSEPKIST
eukprot:scaffold6593_cov100-Isochrysis_galbana.AAC.2